MTQLDYGPVPVSRLKQEGAQVFAALQAGRRVGIARNGRTVAVIEPAAPDRFARELAAFATPVAVGDMDELTATDIGQGSPSEFVRGALAGRRSYVTRAGKVYGVLMSRDEAPSRIEDSEEFALAHERSMVDWEAAHPEASAGEFLEASEGLATEVADRMLPQTAVASTQDQPRSSAAGRASRVVPRLTPRELEALRLLHAGVPRKSIGRRMDPPVSTTTAVTYLSRISAKYREAGRDIRSSSDAIHAAVDDGYLRLA